MVTQKGLCLSSCCEEFGVGFFFLSYLARWHILIIKFSRFIRVKFHYTKACSIVIIQNALTIQRFRVNSNIFKTFLILTLIEIVLPRLNSRAKSFDGCLIISNFEQSLSQFIMTEMYERISSNRLYRLSKICYTKRTLFLASLQVCSSASCVSIYVILVQLNTAGKVFNTCRPFMHIVLANSAAIVEVCNSIIADLWDFL